MCMCTLVCWCESKAQPLPPFPHSPEASGSLFSLEAKSKKSLRSEVLALLVNPLLLFEAASSRCCKQAARAWDAMPS